MSDDDREVTPVHVHIASSAVPAAGPPAARYRTMFETYVLTAGDPVMCILPEDSSRYCALVQAIDNDIVLGPSAGVAGSAVNTVASVPNPNGAYVPKANTAPVRLEGGNAVFAGVTTTATASRVSVIATYRA